MTRAYGYWFLVGLLAGFALMVLMAFAPWFTGPPNVGFPTFMG